MIILNSISASEYQMLEQVAILCWNEMSDKLFLLSFGTSSQEMHHCTPKLFFILFVRGFGKQRPFQISRML